MASNTEKNKLPLDHFEMEVIPRKGNKALRNRRIPSLEETFEENEDDA